MKSIFFCGIFLLFIFTINTRLSAQVFSSGPQVLTFHSNIDDTEQPYGLYLPKNYTASKKYPLVVMLHGAGSNHRLGMRRVFGKSNGVDETDLEASRYFPKWKDVEYIVISTNARGTMSYQGVVEKDVMDMVADAKARFSIDENRTYLTGLSMGGGGSMWLGFSYPDMWAAIAPVCPAPPQGTLALVPNALNVPMRFFQGDKDPAVNVDSTRNWIKRLKGAGTKVEYIEYPGVAHNSWENAYKDASIFDWFSKFKRNPYPERVRYTTNQYKHNKAYWIVFDHITPGKTANIDAKFVAKNKLEITTSKLDGFTVNLEKHPLFTNTLPLKVNIDGVEISVKTKSFASFHNNGFTWEEGPQPAIEGLSKKVGLEGPISEAIASRHIYVYGTAGNPTLDELAQRKAIALKAAEWSVYRGEFLGRIMVFPRLLSDKEVRQSDFDAADLVLFGTKETNTIIEKFSDKLPMHLSKNNTDYGLIYIYPVNTHFVLISSGLPWWTAPEATIGTPSRLNTPSPMTGLAKLQDFMLFKGDNSNVISSGRFDNNWKIPVAILEKLKATDGISLK